MLAYAWHRSRKLAAGSQEISEPDWSSQSFRVRLEPLDHFCLAWAGALFLLLWFRRHELIPIPPDSYYHLMVAREIVQSGAIPLWDTWELHPHGRPHLYPPLFHFLIAGLSIPFRFEVLEGFRVLQALLIPLVPLSVWYAARWLFDARRAFLAFLILGADAAVAVLGLMCIPSLLAGIFALLGAMLFLSKRPIGAAVCMLASLYTHLGVAPLALAGLLLFSLFHREYLKGWLIVAGLAALGAAPWYLRVWYYRDLFVHPLEIGVYGQFGPDELLFRKVSWLQFVNLVLVALMFWAAFATRWRQKRNALLLCYGLGFLPVFFSYGGRFVTHTVPVWAILAAGPVTCLLSAQSTRRRAALFAVLALCPTLVLVGFGTVLPPGVFPMLSGWMLPVAAAIGGDMLVDGGASLGYARFSDVAELAEYIQEHTPAEQPIYVQYDRDFALMVGFLAGRPINLGAWEEVQSPGQDPNQHASQRPPPSPEHDYVWVSRFAGVISGPYRIKQVGPFYVGLPRQGG